MEAHTSNLYSLTDSLICPHNALISHLKLSLAFNNCKYNLFILQIVLSLNMSLLKNRVFTMPRFVRAKTCFFEIILCIFSVDTLLWRCCLWCSLPRCLTRASSWGSKNQTASQTDTGVYAVCLKIYDQLTSIHLLLLCIACQVVILWRKWPIEKYNFWISFTAPPPPFWFPLPLYLFTPHSFFFLHFLFFRNLHPFV